MGILKAVLILLRFVLRFLASKVGCAFPMVISSDFRMGKHRDDDHEEDAPHFINVQDNMSF